MYLLVMGYGACMIDGYPFSPEVGFFVHATDALAEASPEPIERRAVSLGGFPVTRVVKHFEPRIISAGPAIVVLQFGSSDCVMPLSDRGPVRFLKRLLHALRRPKPKSCSTGASSSSLSTRDELHPPTMRDRIRWHMASAIGLVTPLKPRTEIEQYLAAMRQMIERCITDDIRVVVLSPFPFANRHCGLSAEYFSHRLAELCRNYEKATFVDCLSPFIGLPKERVLLSDGMHLSIEAHRILGTVVSEVLKSITVSPPIPAQTDA